MYIIYVLIKIDTVSFVCNIFDVSHVGMYEMYV
jgi:hypothetical protein